MEVNHIFVFSCIQGKEADELVDVGLAEGSNRIHPGQGTRNRKFYFRNFYLEIAWVFDEKQVRNQLVASTGLWERACFQENGFSPFGICFTHTSDLDKFFKGSVIYEPAYIPDGTFFEIITNHEQPDLPWTCRLPAMKIDFSGEPMDHMPGMRNLTKVSFGIKQVNFRNELFSFLKSTAFFDFFVSEKPFMVLEFDNRSLEKTIVLQHLPVSIEF